MPSLYWPVTGKSFPNRSQMKIKFTDTRSDLKSKSDLTRFKILKPTSQLTYLTITLPSCFRLVTLVRKLPELSLFFRADAYVLFKNHKQEIYTENFTYLHCAVKLLIHAGSPLANTSRVSTWHQLTGYDAVGDITGVRCPRSVTRTASPKSPAFYPRDAMLARVFATATCLSVCLSDCPSVTRRYCA